MRRWLLITAVLLGSAATAQINYGREDCGPVFDKWIDDLEDVKALAQDAVYGPALERFKQWLADAQKETRESKYTAIRREPIRYARPLFSVLDVIDNNNKMSSIQEPINASLFFTYYNSAEEREKNIYQVLALLIGIIRCEIVLERSNRLHSYFGYSFYSFNKDKRQEDLQRYLVNSEYKYFLDFIEDNRLAELEHPMTTWEKEVTNHFTEFTGVKPPSWTDKQVMKQYMEIFAQPILYGLGRLMLFDKNNPYYTEMEKQPGPLGDNRYSAEYFNKLFVAAFKDNIEALILHISEMKRLYCAPTNINELGQITVDVETSPAEQVEQREIKEPTSQVPAGKARLLIVAKTSKGRLLNSYDYNIFSLYTSPGTKPLKLAVNEYGPVPPGHYIIKNDKRPYDSVEISLGEGQTQSVDYTPGSAVRAYYTKANGKGIPLDFRIDFLRPKADKFDTVYYDVIRGGKEMELNPGLYYVQPMLPSRFYPPTVGVNVTTQANSLSSVSVSHYGQLSVETYDGLRQRKNVRIDVYTDKIDPSTGERKYLTNIYSQYEKTGREDTLYLEPGIYWIEAQYLFPIGRQVEIASDNLTREPIENLGSLLVTNGTNSPEVIEITDLKNNTQKTAKNNVAVDVPTGNNLKYRVKILGGNNQVFTNVVVRPGQQTTIRW